jgi:uncharacterized repeat protein (TIGR03803 family)
VTPIRLFSAVSAALVVAALTPQPLRAATESVDYTFKGGTDGFFPNGDLVNIKGTLYGTTKFGGGSTACGGGCGTVFKVTSKGAEQVLHAFSFTDGSTPVAGLVNIGGTLYGTTLLGGTSTSCGSQGCGTVFSITPDGTFTVLHNFAGGHDGNTPYASLTNVHGTLYGTTQGGGLYNYGTVFKITTAGVESVIYAFKGQTDGAYPNAPVIGVGKVLYGTTKQGGAYGTTQGGFGTVFSVTDAGAETVLHSFGNGTDGFYPFGALLNVGGTLYGTTYSGGTLGDGTVYALTTAGTETLVYSFTSGTDGLRGVGGLVSIKGLLYGTTQSGGTPGHGTVFNFTKAGAESVIYSFLGGSDGQAPYNGSMIQVSGVLHGVTSVGGTGGTGCGASGCGTVFRIKP